MFFPFFVMVIRSKKNLYRYLFFYRSFLCTFVTFRTTLKDSTSKSIIQALNYKGRYKRIYYVIDTLCNQIDDYYKESNLCDFCNSQCICHRSLGYDYQNGCCRKCRHQSSHGCTTKNFACKMFYCSYASSSIKKLTYQDLGLLKVLTPFQRFVLKSEYFATIEEVSKDLFFGPFISAFTESFRAIKVFFSHENS